MEVSKSKEVGKPVAKQQNATDGQNVLEIVAGMPSDIKEIKSNFVSFEKRVDKLKKAQPQATSENRLVSSDASKDSASFRKKIGPVCYRCGVCDIRSLTAHQHQKGHRVPKRV